MNVIRFRSVGIGIAASLCCVATAFGKPSNSGILHDTVGMAAFIDSLRVDVRKNSLDFLLSHRSADFSGIPGQNIRTGADPLRTNPTFAHETAIFLAWMLQPNRVSYSFDSESGTAIVSPGDSTNPCDPDRGEAEDNYCVWVPDPGQLLFDSIGGRSLGPIKTKWVHRISVKGGQKLKNFYWPIKPDWMRIRLPDGRKGWTKGQDLDDGLGAYITLNLVHQTDGWHVSAIFAQFLSKP
jgi:hypothetical protein